MIRCAAQSGLIALGLDQDHKNLGQRLSTLTAVEATTMIRYGREKGPLSARWINALLEKKPARLASVAVGQ
jgi:hypothetical protein